MNKSEFLALLESKLSSLPKNEIKKSVDYYDEMISDRVEEGVSEEEAVEAIGNIDETVNNIMCDMPMSVLVSSKLRQSHAKSSNKALWTVLIILGSPIWLTLLLALAAVILSLYVVVWSLIIALYAVVLAFGVTSVGCLLGGVAMGFAIPSLSAALFCIGSSAVCLAVMLFSFKPIVFMTKQLVKFTAVCLRKTKAFFFTSKGAVNENV